MESGQADGTTDPYARLRAELEAMAPTQPPEEWQKLLVETKPDLVYGYGTLDVKQHEKEVTVAAGSRWIPSLIDVGREIWIDGDQYTIAEPVDMTKFNLDRHYEKANNAAARYLLSAILVGEPWEVTVPTSLVILAKGAKLSADDVVEDLAAHPAPGP
jgi:hypothetical protein